MDRAVSLKACVAGLFWLIALGLIVIAWVVDSPYLAFFGIVKCAMACVATISAMIESAMREIRGYFNLQEEARRLRSAR
jgi:hypothetical protein